MWRVPANATVWSSCRLRGWQLPFTYALVDLDGQDANPGQLCPGGYVHTTTDGNGCSVADTVTVNGPDTIEFNFIIQCSLQRSGQRSHLPR